MSNGARVSALVQKRLLLQVQSRARNPPQSIIPHFQVSSHAELLSHSAVSKRVSSQLQLHPVVWRAENPDCGFFLYKVKYFYPCSALILTIANGMRNNQTFPLRKESLSLRHKFDSCGAVSEERACWVPFFPLESNKSSTNVVSGEKCFKNHAGTYKHSQMVGKGLLVFCIGNN